MKRRVFLRNASLAIGGAAFAKGNAFAMPRAGHPIGLQLFTFFGVIDKDPVTTLKKIADIGYKEIESAYSFKPVFYGMKPKEFADTLKGLGLSWQSHHVIGAPFKPDPKAKPMTGPDGKPFQLPRVLNLRENMQEIVDQAAEGGIPYLVCSSTPFETKSDLDDSIAMLNKTAEACKKAGIQFGYHNHYKEFDKVDGQVVYDRLLAETAGSGMVMEVDLCWVTRAGVDPVALFQKYPGRFPLWHVKDLDQAKEHPVPVGEGIVNWAPIFAHAADAGMKHLFVEHDMPKDAYASITTSYNYLTNTLHV